MDLASCGLDRPTAAFRRFDGLLTHQFLMNIYSSQFHLLTERIFDRLAARLSDEAARVILEVVLDRLLLDNSLGHLLLELLLLLRLHRGLEFLYLLGVLGINGLIAFISLDDLGLRRLISWLLGLRRLPWLLLLLRFRLLWLLHRLWIVFLYSFWLLRSRRLSLLLLRLWVMRLWLWSRLNFGCEGRKRLLWRIVFRVDRLRLGH